MKTGKAARQLRISCGISKNQLCLRSGLNKGYVYRLENDLVSPTVSTLERVARALEIPVSDIILLAERMETADTR